MTTASGSVGGSTYSHNRYGLYVRARRKPVNPNTTSQQEQRAAFSSATSAWRDLTPEQRAAWDGASSGAIRTNALGQTITLTGQAAYVASNALRLRLGLAAVSDPPASLGRFSLGDLAPDLGDDGALAISGFTTPANGATAGLYLSVPLSDGINFFNGTYQKVFQGVVTANALTGSVPSARNGITLAAGQRLGWRVSAVQTDGQLSTIAQGILTVHAAV